MKTVFVNNEPHIFVILSHKMEEPKISEVTKIKVLKRDYLNLTGPNSQPVNYPGLHHYLIMYENLENSGTIVKRLCLVTYFWKVPHSELMC